MNHSKLINMFFKKPSYQLIQPKPCLENWDEMTPTEQGRFCQKCSKEVVNFTHFTDKQIIQFFKNTNGEICSRTLKSQLNRPLQFSLTPSNKFKKVPLLISGLMTANLSIAQVNQPAKKIEKMTKMEMVKREKTPTVKNKIKFNGKISGVVIDQKSDMPLARVKVVVKNTSLFVKSNSDGSFQLEVPTPFLHEEVLFLEFSRYGYERLQHSILLNDYNATPFFKMTEEQKIDCQPKIYGGVTVLSTTSITIPPINYKDLKFSQRLKIRFKVLLFKFKRVFKKKTDEN